MELEQIYTTYFRDVYLYICKLSNSEHIAEEITSETFFKANRIQVCHINLTSFNFCQHIVSPLSTFTHDPSYRKAPVYFRKDISCCCTHLSDRNSATENQKHTTFLPYSLTLCKSNPSELFSPDRNDFPAN